jgi:hypothetical protein
MGDQSYEIDIDAGRDDEEMQIDDDTPTITRRGRGFGGNTGDSQLNARNGKLASTGTPGPTTAVRCKLPLHLYIRSLIGM